MTARSLALTLAAVAFLVAAVSCERGFPDVVPYEALELPEDAPSEAQGATREQTRLVPDFLELPAQVPLGETLRYVVELENPTDEPISLEPCPTYYQSWGESSVSTSRISHLNCDDAPDEIAPGDAVKFEMQLPITDVDPVTGRVVWFLGGPSAETRADVSISEKVEVTAP